MNILKKYSKLILACFVSFCLLFILAFLNGCQKMSVYNIGFMGPLSGAGSNHGILQAKAVEMAVAEFNILQEVHGYRVGLIIKDSEGDPEVAVKAAEKMLQEDKIVALLGPGFPSVALKVADLLLRAQVPMISGSAANLELTAKSPYIFLTINNSQLHSMVLGPYVANILGHGSMAILHYSDTQSVSALLAQDLAQRYELAGGKITLSLETERQKTGYRDELERLRGTRPEALFLPNLIADTLTMLQDLREMGWDVPVISIDMGGFNSDELIETLGNLVGEAIFTADLIPRSPVTIDFRNRFQTLYGMEPDNFTYNIYDAANIVLGAINTAHNDKTNLFNGALIRQYIQQTKDYPGVSGSITFSQSGDVTSKAVTLLQVQGKSVTSLGNFTVVGDQVIMLP